MKIRSKPKTRKTPVAASKKRPVSRRKKIARTSEGYRRRSRASRTAAPIGKPKSHYEKAIEGIQEAASAMAADDLLEVVSGLAWPVRAKWLSSYFADRISADPESDDAALAQLADDLGAQIAALLTKLAAGQPTDYLHAVTCCLSAEPTHVEAGASWLEQNTGRRTIDLGELDELPGYRLVAEIVARPEDE